MLPCSTRRPRWNCSSSLAELGKAFSSRKLWQVSQGTRPAMPPGAARPDSMESSFRGLLIAVAKRGPPGAWRLGNGCSGRLHASVASNGRQTQMARTPLAQHTLCQLPRPRVLPQIVVLFRRTAVAVGNRRETPAALGPPTRSRCARETWAGAAALSSPLERAGRNASGVGLLRSDRALARSLLDSAAHARFGTRDHAGEQ